ncbi:efflux RND transporter periplasmic adaptor subunit [Parendozoicomonas haliclonae]|uniref:Macrolide export protein MacA n=1 Tax=Parendozoicomonas haliclonae TaxID=1960125 RepID=A0A1X7AKG1_9GAMM|nr:efflux RND transporter periplasmic adaptor subunit [Parendozoicomonas haliclonae]SMA47721.1 Macrolide export protein MacA [Parendozoicomonas haliclonae]
MTLNKGKLAVGVIALSLAGLAAFRLNSYLQPPVMTSEERVIKVSALTVEPAPLTSWVFAEGTVEAQRKAFLDFERAGKVVSVGTDHNNLSLREGSRVSGPTSLEARGQRLASLDSRNTSANVNSLSARLQSARLRREETQANIDRAKNDRELARIAFERTQKLNQQGLISRDALDRDRTALLNAEAAVSAVQSAEASAKAEVESISAELEGALVTLSKDSLFAPFDGVITVMNLREGNYYYPPMGISSNSDRENASAVVVVDDSRYEITLEIPEQSARPVKEGQTVWVSVNSSALYQSAGDGEPADGVMTGRIWSVSPAISLNSRTRKVKVRTDINQPNTLQDGLYAQVWIAAVEKNSTLTLPVEALSFRDRMPFIYVIGNDDRVERRSITTGLEGLSKIEITKGLTRGEKVVIRGQHLLGNDTLVEVVNAPTTELAVNEESGQ